MAEEPARLEAIPTRWTLLDRATRAAMTKRRPRRGPIFSTATAGPCAAI